MKLRDKIDEIKHKIKTFNPIMDDDKVLELAISEISIEDRLKIMEYALYSAEREFMTDQVGHLKTNWTIINWAIENDISVFDVPDVILNEMKLKAREL